MLASILFYSTAGIITAVMLVVLIVFVIGSRSKRPERNTSTAAANQRQAHPDDPVSLILKRTSKLSGHSKCLLLAAGRINDLPVTTAIQLAAALSDSGPCLLIDLDSKRNALAKVFDIDSSHINVDLKVSPVRTPLPNVELWPAAYFDLLKQMNLRLLIDSARKKYAHIILYAPYLSTLADRKQIASCSGHAILFEAAQKERSKLELLLKMCKCKLLLKLQPPGETA